MRTKLTLATPENVEALAAGAGNFHAMRGIRETCLVRYRDSPLVCFE